MFQTIREAIKRHIKVVFLDYEASTDPTYLENLDIDVLHAGGARSKGGWDREPELYYTTPETAESGFYAMHALLKSLGDKIMMEDPKHGMRYFVVQPGHTYSRDWKSITEGLKNKKIFEVEDATPQVVFIVDSLRMLTQAKDDDSDKETIALLARTLNSMFTLVKPYLGRKLCNLVATNHLTINPMAKFGSPESEPGGNAVTFFPDNKTKLVVNRAMSRIITETHVSGTGEDRYLPGTATILKNKGGPVFRKMDYRVWIDEKGSPGRGFCPVFDTYQFLLSTNQMLSDSKGGLTLTVAGYEEHKDMKYEQFKKLILDTPQGDLLRKHCFDQIKEGTAQTLYYENVKSLKDDAAQKKKAKKFAAADSTQGMGDEDDDKDEEERETPFSPYEVAL
jgi:RecA/RadA recombinase